MRGTQEGVEIGMPIDLWTWSVGMIIPDKENTEQLYFLNMPYIQRIIIPLGLCH